MIASVLALVSCGGGDSSSGGSCNSSPFQTWSRSSDGLVFNMNGGTYDNDLVISIGGVCAMGINIGSDGTFQELDCGMSLVRSGTLTASCSTATMVYSDNGEIVNFTK